MTGCSGKGAEAACLTIHDPRAVGHAVELLRRGDLVAFPTDTVYGIGAHAFIEGAVARLFYVKKRPVDLPIPLLLPDTTSMNVVCVGIPPVAWRLAERFWPGGLSLVLARSHVVPDTVTAGGPTVAIRVPDYPPLRDLCRRLGAPLAATSANLHGQPPPVTVEEVGRAFGRWIPLILDGGACPGGVASTVLDLTVRPHAILRPGPVSVAELANIVAVT